MDGGRPEYVDSESASDALFLEIVERWVDEERDMGEEWVLEVVEVVQVVQVEVEVVVTGSWTGRMGWFGWLERVMDAGAGARAGWPWAGLGEERAGTDGQKEAVGRFRQNAGRQAGGWAGKCSRKEILKIRLRRWAAGHA